MTLAEFTQEYVPIITLIIMFLGLGSLILVWYQIRVSTKWNKLKEALSYLNNSNITEYEENLIKKTKGKYKLNEELSTDSIDEIFESKELYFGVKKYLDEIEKISSAVNIGAFDYDFAYTTFSPKVIYNYKTFKNFITKIRSDNDDDNEIYVELEKLALDWETKYLKQKESLSETIARKKKELLFVRGLKKKI